MASGARANLVRSQKQNVHHVLKVWKILRRAKDASVSRKSASLSLPLFGSPEHPNSIRTCQIITLVAKVLDLTMLGVALNLSRSLIV